MNNSESMTNYEKIRARIAAGNAPAYWRSVEELADTPEFQERLKKEFPSQEDKWIDPVTRRSFLKVMGASLALSGLAGCTGFTKPRELILPYTNQPESMVLGKPLFFASVMPFMGYGYPVLVESHEGRPTKIEGNPDHIDSQGAALGFVQASVLDMYDPDRAQAVTYLQELRDWVDFTNELTAKLGELGGEGEGLALITEGITSPTTAGQIAKLQQLFPKMRWVQYDPAGYDNAREGARLAFGDYADTQYNFENADLVVTLDSDFMVEGPSAVRYSKAFAARRRVKSAEAQINRLYTIESTPTHSGTLADHRLLLKPSLIEAFARALAAELGIAGAGAQPNPALAKHDAFLKALAADLKQAAGRSVVVAGVDSSPVVHALAHAINGAIGAVGSTVVYTDPIEARPANQLAELRDLTTAMNAGQVKALVIMGANPVYSAPADLKFEAALKRVPWKVVHSTHFNETALYCQWHVPAPHYLEAWGDIRSGNGTVSIIQPLIAPIYSTRTEHELLQVLAGESGKSSFDIVQDHWKQQLGDANFDKAWRRAVHDGFIADTSAKPRQVTAKTDASAFPVTANTGGEIELAIRRDPTVQDGRFANNAWLQELPKPFSKLTWDNAAFMSMATANKLKVKSEDVIKIKANGAEVEAPVFIVMGHAADCITLHLGYGRTRGGRVAMDDSRNDDFLTPRGSTVGVPRPGGDLPRGVNAYKLWKSDVPRTGIAAAVARVEDKTYPLSCTQLHFSIDENGVDPIEDIPVVGALFEPMTNGENTELSQRGLVRRGDIADLRKFEEGQKHKADAKTTGTAHGDSHTTHSYASELWVGHLPPEKVDFYEGAWDYAKGYAWGMTIDQGVCHGCNACVVACQAENNIPVVGKGEVRNQREMHWIRIDQYYSGDIDSPVVTNQPLPCMHCETAPCEVVCPVAATAHSPEGINEMAYNRCVGTRFCSNNCPYKVRRFNWFFYTKNSYESPLAKMVNNPDVTVRSRGVMEKCTYCVQRVNSARIEAENEGRAIRDGDIVVACEATCPTDAIVFGNVNDPNSRVSKLKAGTLNYGLLSDMNTKPRTTYLAVISNPNPEIKEA